MRARVNRVIRRHVRRRISRLLMALGKPLYANAVMGWAPIAGGAAPGAPAGGGSAGAPAPGDAGGAAGGAEPPQDPWGFQPHIEGADEVVRPYLERVFGELGPQLQQRFDEARGPLEPLQPYADKLTPLLEKPEGAQHAPLEGLLDFYDMTGNPERLEEFADWFDAVGEEYGFFEDDEPGEPMLVTGEPGEAGAEDPRDAEIAQLREELAEVRGEIQTTKSETAVQRQQQTFHEQLTTQMTENGIVDPEDVPDEQKPSTVILRLAESYVNAGQADDAIANGVRDYLTITGQAQGALVAGAGEATAPAANPLLDVAHVGGGRRPGASLGGGSPDTEPEAVSSWKDARRIAESRLRAG